MSDTRSATVQTTNSRPHYEFIVIGLVLCILLLLLVIVLLLHRLSAPLQPTIRVEMNQVPVTSHRASGAAGSGDFQLPGDHLKTTLKEARRTKAGKAEEEDASIMERIVEDNVALCEELASFAA